MLQSKHWTLISFLAIVLTTLNANAFLISAAGAGSEDFQKYTYQSNQQTYAQWKLQEMGKTSADAHESLLQFSEKAQTEAWSQEDLKKQWQLVRQSLSLRRADREVLVLLAEKLRNQEELCRYILLEPTLKEVLEKSESSANCQKKAQAFPFEIRERLEAGDVLLLDGKAFPAESLPSFWIPGHYQWQVLSNRFQDRVHWGTYSEFLEILTTAKPWVEGTCENYQAPSMDFSSLVQARVFFSSTCQASAIPQERTWKDWAKEHQTLLWGVGILAAGAAAYSLKDKTLVITRP